MLQLQLMLLTAAVMQQPAALASPAAATGRQLLLLSRAATAEDPSWTPRPANSNVSGGLSFSSGGMTVAYDFTRAAHARPGSTYMGAKWTPPRGGLLSKAPLGSTLGFQLRTNVSRWGFLRVVDSSGQTFQSTWAARVNAMQPTVGGEWRLLEQSLRAENISAHFMGADDGVIHLPLTTIEIDLV